LLFEKTLDTLIAVPNERVARELLIHVAFDRSLLKSKMTVSAFSPKTFHSKEFIGHPEGGGKCDLCD